MKLRSIWLLSVLLVSCGGGSSKKQGHWAAAAHLGGSSKKQGPGGPGALLDQSKVSPTPLISDVEKKEIALKYNESQYVDIEKNSIDKLYIHLFHINVISIFTYIFPYKEEAINPEGMEVNYAKDYEGNEIKTYYNDVLRYTKGNEHQFSMRIVSESKIAKKTSKMSFSNFYECSLNGKRECQKDGDFKLAYWLINESKGEKNGEIKEEKTFMAISSQQGSFCEGTLQGNQVTIKAGCVISDHSRACKFRKDLVYRFDAKGQYEYEILESDVVCSSFSL